ncbi:TspO/MBR family protein [Salsipaludibacter albus]|uniref:TspO/MBR family protein n=1 Tax=Salsipaludibacter albus TaxID=2849650 RepID=UPI001EE4E202|nr:TspO/MBR family protein [Salsipaludibacter albus]MBY5163303.1 tryptophan-rich sensory protein [Salsipaludibacter albus]
MTSPGEPAVPTTRRWLALAGFLAASFAAAGIAVSLQGGGVEGFYTSLDLPAWAPPSWLFGPVWTVLYIAIAVAAWRVWEHAGWTAALTVWSVQLVFNAAWTPAFFNLQFATLALAIIVVLLGLVLVTIALMARHDRVAVALMVPYALWVGFATALTLAIWVLNPNLR